MSFPGQISIEHGNAIGYIIYPFWRISFLWTFFNWNLWCTNVRFYFRILNNSFNLISVDARYMFSCKKILWKTTMKISNEKVIIFAVLLCFGLFGYFINVAIAHEKEQGSTLRAFPSSLSGPVRSIEISRQEISRLRFLDPWYRELSQWF